MGRNQYLAGQDFVVYNTRASEAAALDSLHVTGVTEDSTVTAKGTGGESGTSVSLTPGLEITYRAEGVSASAFTSKGASVKYTGVDAWANSTLGRIALRRRSPLRTATTTRPSPSR